MAKTRAEIQRAYRERKKAANKDAWLQKERSRINKYYIPADKLTRKERSQRNQKNKIRNRKSRDRKKQIMRALIRRESDNEIETQESGYSSLNEASGSSNRLIVQLPSVRAAARANGGKKARARALARAHKSISLLQKQKANLEKKLNTKRKQIERISRRMKRPLRELNKSEMSPSRITENEVNQLSLTPRRKKSVYRKLLMTNVLVSEIRKSKTSSSTKKRNILHRIVAGKTAQKYRCVNSISKFTGLSRRALLKTRSKSLVTKVEQRRCLSRAIRNTVLEFLGREDNCRIQPGKADVKKGQQTTVLTDYMRNLYQKFIAENTNMKISFSTFCRLRPKHTLLARYISRNACQCLRHQNAAFKVQAMRKIGIKISENPENICLHKNDIKQLFQGVDENVTNVKYKTWKKVDVENKFKKMMVVETEVTLQEFENLVEHEVAEFCEHVNRLREQYKQLKINKDTLADKEAIVQMDFSENYSCRALDEVQTAYWSLTAVTLHPVVIYYKEDNVLKHKSLVIVSDTLVHSAATVHAFIDAIVPELKKYLPDVQRIHYWTDSPSSQYRNRFIFHVLANHRKLYKCDAQWNYFEAGHGKSACDGLGGTTKRLADEACRQGHVMIQNAFDFHKWGQQSSMKEVEFLFVEKSKCEQKQADFANLKVKAVRNTMKLHAITSDPTNTTILRTHETSCYCELCNDKTFCSKWTVEKYENARETNNNGTDEIAVLDKTNNEQHEECEMKAVQKGAQNPKNDHNNLIQEQEPVVENTYPKPSDTSVFDSITIDDFVAAKYDENVYIGKVKAIDRDEGDCQIDFMEKAKELYKWPVKKDLLWVDSDDILVKLNEPLQTGKSRRLFKITDEEKELIGCMIQEKI